MSKRIKRKAVIAIVLEIICIVALGIFLSTMQTNLTVRDQQHNTEQKLQQVRKLLEQSDKEATRVIEDYDLQYMDKADSISYMYANGVLKERDNSQMKELANLMQVSNVLLLDKKGNILAEAKESPANFTYNRFNQLRTVFTTDEVSEPFGVIFDEKKFRYYGAKVDNETMAVIEQNTKDLDTLLESTNTYENLLGNVTVGLNGYPFVISGQYYTFEYHPDSSLIGTDALDAGVDVKELADNNYAWLTVNGERLYSGVIKLESGDYVVCAVEESEIKSSRDMTVAIIVFILFAVMTLVTAYAILLMAQKEADGECINGGRKGIRYNHALGTKLGVISLIGLIVIMVVTFYMQTLFALSRQGMSNSQRVLDVEENVARNEEQIAFITEQYNEEYLSKCRIIAYALQANPELESRDKLAELSDVLDVEAIYRFNSEGVMTSTNSSYTNFVVSEDPKEQSYEFRKLLFGVDHVIQKAMPDELSQELRQYIGVSIMNSDGTSNGFVQVSVKPTRLEEALETTSIDNILKDIKVGKGGFVFSVDKESKKFNYYPQKKMIGRSAKDYGMTDEQFVNGYSNYIKLEGKNYYGSSLELEDAYAYVVVPEKAMTSDRIPVAVATAVFSFAALLMLFLLMTLNNTEKAAYNRKEEDGEHESPMVDVTMPDGSVKKTSSAASRWDNISMKWMDRTPDQQLAVIMKGMFAIFALAICAAVLFKDRFFGSDSIFVYILDGKWDRGMNIFALTGSFMIICVASVATMVVRKILQMLSHVLDARGETVCRLLRNVVKYGAILVVLYYCLALFGVDTATLVASAGILTLVVGLGANSLVTDILAGLFIIFEGEFRVGDIVTIAGWRGTVVEIGMRTTKIEAAGGDVKIISNKDVSGVINMTRKHSFASCTVGIEYGESLERVENILQKEFPNIRRRLPAIVDGPFYKGVSSLGDNSVNIMILVQCSENDRIQMERDLNREMKLIFDKYNISIPFPQVVVNEPTVFEKATEWEKWKADQFNKEQKELSKKFAEDDDDDR